MVAEFGVVLIVFPLFVMVSKSLGREGWLSMPAGVFQLAFPNWHSHSCRQERPVWPLSSLSAL